MNTNAQKIRHALADLPENIQHAVNIFNWEKIIPSIASKYNIQLDEAWIFQEETMKVVVGISPSSEYKKNLMKALNINSQLAEALLFEANTHIFKELQRLAFNSKDDVDDDIVSSMKDEGIHLIDHEEDMTVDFDEVSDHLDEETQVEKQVSPSGYSEEITEDDLIGIYGHRIKTEAILEKKDFHVEESLHGKTRISKEDSLIVKDINDGHLDVIKNNA